MRGRAFISNGFAKAYSMTGWRVGYLVGPAAVIKDVATVQSHSTSNVCTFAQYGAIAALNESQDCVEVMRQAFAERREMVLARLGKIDGIACDAPGGAFYVFPDISAFGLGSVEFCDRLLQEHHVAGIPGAAFGADGNVRFSYATDTDTLMKGLDRLEAFVKTLR